MEICGNTSGSIKSEVGGTAFFIADVKLVEQRLNTEVLLVL